MRKKSTIYALKNNKSSKQNEATYENIKRGRETPRQKIFELI